MTNSFGKEKFHAANGKAQHAFMLGPVFSFWEWGRVGRNIFCFVFFLVSECVPKGFLSSQSVLKCIPQDVTSSTWVLSHMVCTKFNSYV